MLGRHHNLGPPLQDSSLIACDKPSLRPTVLSLLFLHTRCNCYCSRPKCIVSQQHVLLSAFRRRLPLPATNVLTCCSIVHHSKMDSATAQVVLKLQLDDVDAILKTLPKTDKNGAVNSERVAFAALGDELLRKWNNLRGQAFARNIGQEENSSREAYKKLLSEEQQAERKYTRLSHATPSRANTIEATMI